uniref:Uncharacterized protein n=1 Tax=Anopheles dirus TaxID=7168 RepID=A0A182NH14_9DIPT
MATSTDPDDTDDVLLVGDETAPDQRRFAHRADEAIVVPVAILERDEARTADAWNGTEKGKFGQPARGCGSRPAGHLPVMGLVQEVHLFANSSPKHSAQYGFSSRLVKRWPASDTWQCVHVKHSRCHGSFLYVTPPLVMIWGGVRKESRSARVAPPQVAATLPSCT